jgi:hypothetical protein
MVTSSQVPVARTGRVPVAEGHEVRLGRFVTVHNLLLKRGSRTDRKEDGEVWTIPSGGSAVDFVTDLWICGGPGVDLKPAGGWCDQV